MNTTSLIINGQPATLTTAAIPVPTKATPLTLRHAFVAALVAGEAANTGEDGGTCNFDAAMIHLPRVKAAMIKEAAELAGVNVDTGYGRFWNGYWRVALPASTGQGNRNTRVAKAMEKAIQDTGFKTMLYQQSD